MIGGLEATVNKEIERKKELDSRISADGNIIARTLLKMYGRFAEKYKPTETKSKFVKTTDYVLTSLIYGRFTEEEQKIVSEINGIPPYKLTVGYESMATSIMVATYMTAGFATISTIGIILSAYTLLVGTSRASYALITKKTFRSFDIGNVFLNYKANIDFLLGKNKTPSKSI